MSNGGSNTPTPMKKNKGALLIWCLVILILLMWNYQKSNKPVQDLSYSSFLEEIAKKNVSEVKISQNRESFTAYLKNAVTSFERQKNILGITPPNAPLREVSSNIFLIHKKYGEQFEKELREQGVKVNFEPASSENGGIFGVFLIWFPMLLFIGIWVFFMRRMQGGIGGAGSPFSFGKSKARLISDKHVKTLKFSDVGGCDEAKEELKEVVDFLKDPYKFSRLGGKIPKGVLLVGPTGTGKTHLAKAVAGEAGVPFFIISGSDFVEMFVGVGASRVRDLFEQGKNHAPCIIFMDEIDAVGRHRGAGIGGGHDEREQTLNQLLVEMDGFETEKGVIIIAATNRPDVLDQALLRPGRFDRHVVVPRPDLRGREEILKIHARNISIDASVDLHVLARSTPGLVGADLAKIINEAALLAARKNRQSVIAEDLEDAKDKAFLGIERKSAVISESEKKVIAYHEGGHALVGAFIHKDDPQNSDLVHKVTIIPRGNALGVTHQLPLEDKNLNSKKYLLNKIAGFLGGRLAEKIALKDITTGASSDLKGVTKLVRKMVTEWGMSDNKNLQFRTFGEQQELIFLAREFGHEKDYSEETARLIDEEIKKILDECGQTARTIIENNLEKLHALASALIQRETLMENEINRILGLNPAS